MQLQGHYFSVLLLNTTASPSRCLFLRQQMQGEEVAGMNVPRDQSHLTSAWYTAKRARALFLTHLCLRIKRFPPSTIIRAFVSSKPTSYVNHTLQVQVSHEASFQEASRGHSGSSPSLCLRYDAKLAAPCGVAAMTARTANKLQTPPKIGIISGKGAFLCQIEK